MPDSGNKTLAQLAAEHNEPKYITLETASKLSGYTKEYLERLCRLGKVEYRLWNNGQIVPELESLLKETHTILISYEAVNTINKEVTTPATPLAPQTQVAVDTSMMDQYRANVGEREAVTFVSRPVISNLDGEPNDATGSHMPIPVTDDETPPINAAVKIAPFHEDLHAHEKVAVPVSSGDHQDWDAVLLGDHADVLPPDLLSQQEEVHERPAVVYHINVESEDEPEHSPTSTGVSKVMGEIHHEFPVMPPVQQAQPVQSVQTVQREDRAQIVSPYTPATPAPVISSTPPIRPSAPMSTPARVASVPTPPAPPAPRSPMPIVSSPSVVSTTRLPARAESHELMPIDPHPLLRNTAFNLTLVAITVFLAGLIGFTVAGERSSVIAAKELNTPNAMVASVQSAFSDEILLEQNNDDGTVVVKPVFKDHHGEPHEFKIMSAE